MPPAVSAAAAAAAADCTAAPSVCAAPIRAPGTATCCRPSHVVGCECPLSTDHVGCPVEGGSGATTGRLPSRQRSRCCTGARTTTLSGRNRRLCHHCRRSNHSLAPSPPPPEPVGALSTAAAAAAAAAPAGAGRPPSRLYRRRCSSHLSACFRLPFPERAPSTASAFPSAPSLRRSLPPRWSEDVCITRASPLSLSPSLPHSQPPGRVAAGSSTRRRCLRSIAANAATLPLAAPLPRPFPSARAPACPSAPSLPQLWPVGVCPVAACAAV